MIWTQYYTLRFATISVVEVENGLKDLFTLLKTYITWSLIQYSLKKCKYLGEMD